jgi:hypothetical protein
MKDSLDQLNAVARALEDRALVEHRARVAVTEARLAEVREIDGLRDAARDAQRDISIGRLVGADMIWQGWLLRRRATALREAALARAAEADSAAQARLALARHDATVALQKHEAEKARAAAALRRDMALDGLMILQAARAKAR